MVQERIDIIVNDKGSVTVKRNLAAIGSSAKGAESSVRLLGRALGAFAPIATVRILGGMADEYTNVQNRLRNVTVGTGELVAVTNELFEISNRTRLSFASTAEVYARTALAVKDMGISQEQTLQFTESLNQAVVLSGASAAEAQAGMIQLSQGLASGALRGDELRSVLEQLPAVADVIAKSLKVTRGELRTMGQDGKITAQVVLKAFKEAREELAGKFAKTIPTLGQAFTVFRNNIVQFVGGLDTATGVSSGLSKIILDLAGNMETLGRAVGAVAIAVGITLATRAIPAAIAGIKALTLAAAANPFGAMAIAIVAVVGGLVAFGDQITVGVGSLATLQDFGLAVWEQMSVAVETFIAFFEANFGFIGSLASSTFGGIEFSMQNVLLIGASVVDSFVGIWAGAYQAIVFTFEALPAAFKDIFNRALNGAIALVEGGVNRISAAISVVTDFAGLGRIAKIQLGRVENDARGGVKNLTESIKAGFAAGFEFDGVASTIQDTLIRAEGIAGERLQRQKVEAAKVAAARAGLAAADAGAGAADPAETKRLAKLLESLTKPLADLKQKQTDLIALYDTGKISLTQYTEAMRSLNVETTALDNTLSGGIENGFARMAEQANNLGATMSDFVVGAFESASDAVVEFARTGKLNIRDFFGDLAAQLLKISTNQLFASLLSGFGGAPAGGAGGGGLATSIASSVSGFMGFENGGSFKVGGSGGPDSQLVAFKASPTETVSITTPGQENAAQQQAPAPVNVRVVNVSDPRESLAALDTEEGQRTIMNIIERNPSTVRRLLGSAT